VRYSGLTALAALTTCFICLSFPAAARGGGVVQKWVRTYFETRGILHQANAVATDAQGNVLVTGSGGTIKYSPQGRLLWERPDDGLNGTAIALDGQANVHVTGSSAGAGTGTDYLTIKYSSDGELLWESRYHGTGNGKDCARAIALDPQGNVYVTGYSDGGAGFYYDYATLKYNPDGALLWEGRYNGPGNGDDVARTIAVDRQGNAYVTGRSYSGSSHDFYTIKYDPNGRELWARRYAGLYYSGACAIAVDGQGFVYVTGITEFDGHGTTVTIKYDTDGRELWVSLYRDPQLIIAGATALALDRQGNVFITGRCDQKHAASLYLTVKYSPQGRQLWARFYGRGNLVARAIAVDGGGNVFITGNNDWEVVTVKYSSTGSELWAQHYIKEDYGSIASALSLDNRGNLYVTGTSGSVYLASDKYLTIKYYQFDGPRRLKP
jgi:hypothetical protein